MRTQKSCFFTFSTTPLTKNNLSFDCPKGFHWERITCTPRPTIASDCQSQLLCLARFPHFPLHCQPTLYCPLAGRAVNRSCSYSPGESRKGGSGHSTIIIARIRGLVCIHVRGKWCVAHSRRRFVKRSHNYVWHSQPLSIHPSRP